MGWHCHVCNIPNKPQAEYCEKCGGHWGTVWIRQDRRSKSQKQKERREAQKEKKDKEGKTKTKTDVPDGMQDWQVFPSKVPWVNSTPQARLNMPSATERTVGLADIPPPPTLRPPPVQNPQTSKPVSEPLSMEEKELIKHLRGLQDLGSVEMPASLMAQVQALENREEEQQTNKPLTHSHINRLHKLQGQASAQLTKVQNLDSEWNGFLSHVQEKLAIHVSMYRSCRAEMVSTYHIKLQELEEAKLQVSSASKSLVDQLPAQAVVPTAPDAENQVMQIQQQLQQEAEQVELLSDEELNAAETEEGAVEAEESTAPRTKPSVTIGAFRHSPSRVANFNVKQAKAIKGAPKDTK